MLGPDIHFGVICRDRGEVNGLSRVLRLFGAAFGSTPAEH